MKKDKHIKIFFNLGLFLILSFFIFPNISQAATSVTQYGITWNFDGDYQTGQYVNGDYWVVGPVRIINIDPAPSYVEGRYRNGSMVNPDVNYQVHGFDSNIAGYSQTVNVGYNNAGNINLSAGDSLISSISTDLEPNLGRSTTIHAVLTVVASAPAINSFRPSYLNTDKMMNYTTDDIDTSILKNLTPAVGMPAWSEAEKRILPLHPFFIKEYFGSHVLARGIDSDYLPSYGREIARDVGVIALMLNSNSTIADKRNTLIGFIQRGLDDYSVYRAYRIENNLSFPWHPDGGIKQGHKLPILLAGHLLNDNAMKNIGFIPEKFHEDAQLFYVTQAEVDLTNSASWNPDDRAPIQPYSSAHIGMPEWGLQHNRQPAVDNAHWDANYRRCCNALSNSGTALAVLALGLKSSWNHDVFFDYQHRYMAIEKGDPDPFGYVVDGTPILNPPGWRTADAYWLGSGTWMTAMFDEYWQEEYTNLPPNSPIGLDVL
ncbi:MAG: hypothetical protein GX765_00200 [Candidatus Moranbacteria bacterium]|nr:hypothetical protein [Candidatus Moranbacteria bacterium]